eukprot:12929576-Ditylum_brightwellii.AAC.1
MESILNHDRDKNTTVYMKDKYIRTHSRRKDKSELWVQMKDIKESHPTKVAEYARVQGIDDEPDFVWWVPYTLRKHDLILSSAKARI